MATYRAVARLKMDGTGENDFGRGDKVTAKDVGGQKDLDRLVESGSVMTADEFAVAFPGFDKEDDAASEEEVDPSELESPEGKEAAEAEAKAKAEEAKAEADALAKANKGK